MNTMCSSSEDGRAVAVANYRPGRKESGLPVFLLLGLFMSGCDVDRPATTRQATDARETSATRPLSPDEADRFWDEFTRTGQVGREYLRQAQRPLPLVEELYELGAAEVWVDGNQYSTQVIVEFPESRVARQALIDRLTSEDTADVQQGTSPRNVGRRYYGVYLTP